MRCVSVLPYASFIVAILLMPMKSLSPIVLGYEAQGDARQTDNEDEAVRLKSRFDSKVVRDDSLPGHPVVEVSVYDAKGTLEETGLLGTLKSFKSLHRLFLGPDVVITPDEMRVLGALEKLEILHLGCRVTPESLAELARFKGLKELGFQNPGCGDKEVQAISGLSGLTTLWLAGTGVTDAGFEHLGGLAHLKNLNLARCQGINNPAIDKLKGIENLNLSGNLTLADEVFINMAGLASLKELDLHGNRAISDKGFKALGQLRGLEGLEVGWTNITDDALKGLAGLKHLRRLGLACTQIGDVGLGHLRGISTLEHLDLNGCRRVTDTGLLQLAPLSNMRVLKLNLLGHITDKSVATFRTLGKLEELCLACPLITDAAVKDLKQLQNLKSLDIGCTKITDAGLKELSEALPNTRVHR